jgi:hypothetical protein
MTAVATEVSCPKCGGKTWDNRETKTNPKAPDFKCRDRSCDGVIWPPKNGAAPKAAARPAPATAKAPMALGATMPWEEEETGAAPAAAPVRAPAPARSDLTTEFALYSRCLDQARAEFLRTQLDQLGGDVAGAIVAAAATLFIQASRK